MCDGLTPPTLERRDGARAREMLFCALLLPSTASPAPRDESLRFAHDPARGAARSMSNSWRSRCSLSSPRRAFDAGARRPNPTRGAGECPLFSFTLGFGTLRFANSIAFSRFDIAAGARARRGRAAAAFSCCFSAVRFTLPSFFENSFTRI